MSEEVSAVEESMKEVLIDLMTEIFMSERVKEIFMYVGVQASSTRGVKASSSTTRGARPSGPSAENRTKHRYDLAKVKLIPTIFLAYIPPLVGVAS
jgi:hypothetical protein